MHLLLALRITTIVGCVSSTTSSPQAYAISLPSLCPPLRQASSRVHSQNVCMPAAAKLALNSELGRDKTRVSRPTQGYLRLVRAAAVYMCACTRCYAGATHGKISTSNVRTFTCICVYVHSCMCTCIYILQLAMGDGSGATSVATLVSEGDVVCFRTQSSIQAGTEEGNHI